MIGGAQPGGAAVGAQPDWAGLAAVIDEPNDKDYGSREFSVRDPEGNRWSFGTYRARARRSAGLADAQPLEAAVAGSARPGSSRSNSALASPSRG